MDVSLIAPLVRGLSLSIAAKAAVGGDANGVAHGVVVASREVASTPIPGAAYKVALPIPAVAGGDDTAILAALGAAVPASASLPFLLAVTDEAKTRLFAVAPTLDEARLLLEEGPHAAATHPAGAPSIAAKIAQARQPGSAASRAQVVEGKIALVTGGAQGFGEEIVRGLVSSGAFVWIADMNAAGAQELADELNKESGRTVALSLPIDVSNEDSVRRAFETVASATGGLDLVVSNAGILKAGGVLEQDTASFELVTRVNYTGFFLVTKHAGRLLRSQSLACPGYRSDIVQVNSKSGLAGSNRNGAYAGSKFGGIGLVQSFALELVEFGIKVNAICPGNFFDGPLWSDPVKGLFVQYLKTGKVPGATTVAQVKAFYEAKVPMGRGCEGPDVMRALYYLVEQEYETGQALPVTGGQVMLN